MTSGAELSEKIDGVLKITCAGQFLAFIGYVTTILIWMFSCAVYVMTGQYIYDWSKHEHRLTIAAKWYTVVSVLEVAG